MTLTLQIVNIILKEQVFQHLDITQQRFYPIFVYLTEDILIAQTQLKRLCRLFIPAFTDRSLPDTLMMLLKHGL
jgi:hypothetical protein